MELSDKRVDRILIRKGDRNADIFYSPIGGMDYLIGRIGRDCFICRANIYDP